MVNNKNKIRYVDMCVYIDKHILDKDADIERIYKYLVEISRMLAIKKKFFNNKYYYEAFANYFATIIYNRMTDKRQFLPEDDPNWLSPIKSCLNYMKGILYARKCAFCYEEFNRNADTNKVDEAEILKYNINSVKSTLLDSSKDIIRFEIIEYFNKIDRIIKSEVYNGFYGKDKVLAYKIYTAVTISLLRNFTLSNKNKFKLIDFRKMHKNNSSETLFKFNYEDILSQCMIEETKTAPIAYDLPDEYLDYIAVLVQKIKNTIIKDIKFLSDNYDVTDSVVEDILLSNIYSNNDKET